MTTAKVLVFGGTGEMKTDNMAELFDKAVEFLGAGASLRALASVVGAERDDLGVAAMLSIPVVIANLAQVVDDDTAGVGRRRGSSRPDDVAGLTADPGAGAIAWLAAESEAIEPVDVGGLASLATAPGRRQAGAAIDVRLGTRRGRVVDRIAERSSLTRDAVDGVLDAATWVVLSELGKLNRSGLDESAMAALLVAERDDLAAVGWGPWLETAVDEEKAATGGAPSSLPVVGRRPVTGRAAYPPPRPASERGLPAGPTPVPAVERARLIEPAPESSTVVGAPDAVPALVAGPARPTHRRRSTRPLGYLVAGSLVAGIAIAAILAALRSDADGTGHSDVVDGTGHSDVADAVETDVGGSRADDAGDRERVGVGPERSPIEIAVTLTDPLGRTTAIAEGVFSFSTATGEICYDLSVDGLNGPYDGHIHVGPAGVKGGIVVDLGALDGAPIGCIDNRPVDTAAILADRAGHYVELHDIDGVLTIRQQLAPGPSGDEPQPGQRRGARLVVGTGVIVMEGEVPDRETADKFAESFADLPIDDTRLVDELVVVAGAPRPSGRIVVGDAIEFDFDSAELTDPEAAVFDLLATLFRARPAWTMTVVGHTDASGSEVYNLELSLRRAEAVRDALIERNVNPDALTVQGAGTTDPVADNGSREGRARNRRIEFEIVAR